MEAIHSQRDSGIFLCYPENLCDSIKRECRDIQRESSAHEMGWANQRLDEVARQIPRDHSQAIQALCKIAKFRGIVCEDPLPKEYSEAKALLAGQNEEDFHSMKRAKNAYCLGKRAVQYYECSEAEVFFDRATAHLCSNAFLQNFSIALLALYFNVGGKNSDSLYSMLYSTVHQRVQLYCKIASWLDAIPYCTKHEEVLHRAEIEADLLCIKPTEQLRALNLIEKTKNKTGQMYD